MAPCGAQKQLGPVSVLSHEVALLLAVQAGDADQTSTLLKSGVLPDKAVDTRGNTALHIAAMNGHARIVRALVFAGARMENTHSNDALSPLRLAAERGHLPTVKTLLDLGADMNSRCQIDRATPLHAAAEGGHAPVVVELARRGARVEARATSGQTPLRWALSLGQRGTATALLRAGADPDAPDRLGACCLHAVAALRQEGNCDDIDGDRAAAIVSQVQASVAGPSMQLFSSSSSPPIPLPVSSPAMTLAEFLLDAGASPNRVRRSQRLSSPPTSSPPAACAVVPSSAETQQEQDDNRVATRASPIAAGFGGYGACSIGNGTGGDGTLIAVGETPLHVAARESSVGVARLLLRRGANPNAKTSSVDGGFSALHLAAVPGNGRRPRAIVRALLEAGANMNAVSADGDTTPLRLACLNAALGCVAELLQWGADDPACVPRHPSKCLPSCLPPISSILSAPRGVSFSSSRTTPASCDASGGPVGVRLRVVDGPFLRRFVGSRVPRSARDSTDCRQVVNLLQKEPLNRAWKRRAWLVMLFARLSNTRDADENISATTVCETHSNGCNAKRRKTTSSKFRLAQCPPADDACIDRLGSKGRKAVYAGRTTVEDVCCRARFVDVGLAAAHPHPHAASRGEPRRDFHEAFGKHKLYTTTLVGSKQPPGAPTNNVLACCTERSVSKDLAVTGDKGMWDKESDEEKFSTVIHNLLTVTGDQSVFRTIVEYL